MTTFILGILLGASGAWLFLQDRNHNIKIRWYGWLLLVLGAGSIAFGFEVLFGSIAEFEPQAGWLGLGLFGFIGLVLLIASWRFGIESPKKAAPEATA